MLPQVEMPPSLLLLINSEYIMVHTSTIHQGTTSITYDTVSLAQDITTEWTLTTLTIPLTTQQLLELLAKNNSSNVGRKGGCACFRLGFAAATSAAAGGFNYEFRVSVPGYGVDNGLNRLLVLGRSWTYTPRRGREVQLLFCLFIY